MPLRLTWRFAADAISSTATFGVRIKYVKSSWESRPRAVDRHARNRRVVVRVDPDRTESDDPARRCRHHLRHGRHRERNRLDVVRLDLVTNPDQVELRAITHRQHYLVALGPTQRDPLVRRIDGDDVGDDPRLLHDGAAGPLPELGTRRVGPCDDARRCSGATLLELQCQHVDVVERHRVADTQLRKVADVRSGDDAKVRSIGAAQRDDARGHVDRGNSGIGRDRAGGTAMPRSDTDRGDAADERVNGSGQRRPPGRRRQRMDVSKFALSTP